MREYLGTQKISRSGFLNKNLVDFKILIKVILQCLPLTIDGFTRLNLQNSEITERNFSSDAEGLLEVGF